MRSNRWPPIDCFCVDAGRTISTGEDSSLLSTSIHSAPRYRAFRRECECRFRCRRAGDQPCHMLSDGGPVFEPVTGAAAHEPDVVVLRVAIDEEVATSSVLVLADATLNEW